MTPEETPRPAELQRLGRYRLVRPLSKGGMALVYEARRESLAGVSPRVAIKLILPEHADSATFKELFINEARLGASMHHQNLVQIQDFDSDGERYFLVMEYVEGLTLRRIIALCDRYGLRIPLGVVAEIGRQACEGLQYAHEASDERGEHLALVHRDIKPSNLILNPHGVVKVLDFGISKGRLREERKGSVKGTWGYMAPEQATGRGVLPVSDVFGLAVVLYELASLRPMFVDKGKDEIKRLLGDDHAARVAATLDPEYGPLVRVLIRALQRDPKARYRSAVEFGRALSALLPDPITARDETTRFFERISALEEGSRRSIDPGESLNAAAPLSQGSILVEDAPEPRSRAGLVISGIMVLGLGTVLVAGAIGAGAIWLNRAPSLQDTDLPLGAVVVPEPAGPAGEGAPGERRPPPGRPPPAAASTEAPQEDAPGEAEVPEEEVPVVVRVVRPEDIPPPPPPDVEPPAPVVQTVRGDAGDRIRPQPVAFGVDGDEPDDATGLLVVDARQPAEIYVSGQFVSVTPLKRKLPPGRYAVSIVAEDGRRRTFEVEVETGKKVRRVWDFERNSWR